MLDFLIDPTPHCGVWGGTGRLPPVGARRYAGLCVPSTTTCFSDRGEGAADGAEGCMVPAVRAYGGGVCVNLADEPLGGTGWWWWPPFSPVVAMVCQPWCLL